CQPTVWLVCSREGRRIPAACRQRKTAGDGDLATKTAGPSDRSPRWSPDGRLLAFLRTTPGDGAEGRTQIWVMPADGGEARPVTFIREAPGEIAWAPDSRRLAFVARVGPEGLRPARGAGREDGPGRDGP